MDSTSEQTESNDINHIKEKVKNKLQEYEELKCLFNLSNASLRYKRNMSLICQERIEKNLNINPNKNNYYSGKNASINVFNLKSLMDDVFGDYIAKHNINIKEELKKMEEEKVEKEENNKMGNSKKGYGSVKPKKSKNLKDQVENNQNDGRKNKKNTSVYVINDKKYKTKPGPISNCKRKSVLENKKENKKDSKENKENKEKNKENNDNTKKVEEKKKNNILVVINTREKNRDKKEKNMKKEVENNILITDKNTKILNITPKNNNVMISTNFINSVKDDFNQENIQNKYNTAEKYNSRFLGIKDNKITPKKLSDEIKKQKSYTYKRFGRFENKFADYNRNRFLNYRSRSKSNYEIENEKKIKNEDMKKSKSVRRLKNRRRHHRHHHFQHFKKPKRIIKISKLESFSVIQYN